MSEDAPATLTEVLRDGETLLLWSHCSHEDGEGVFALTSDRVLFINDAPMGISLAQRIAQGRRMRLHDGVLELSTSEREASFSGLDREVIDEIVGTLAKKVKVSNPALAARIKSNRKRVRKRVIHCMTHVPKTVVARDLGALPPES